MNAPAVKTRPRDMRVDLMLIAEMIEPGARVLDIGCGDGTLLHHLVRTKDVDGRGMDLSQAAVKECVSHGLSAIQADADRDLRDYPSQAFDYVVLSRTLQATHNPRLVLEELVRIGRRAIVSFANFGYWRVRWRLISTGRMPHADTVQRPWYENPNIHPCTIRDFLTLCRGMDINVERQVFANREGRPGHFQSGGALTNLFAEQGVFRLARE